MAKKELLVENILEKIVMALLKGRYKKITKELSKDPELLKATEKLNQGLEDYKALLQKIKEKHGVDLNA